MDEAVSTRLPSEINLHVKRTPKFKTVYSVLTMHSDLSWEAATKNALLPTVLRRGTRRYPLTVDLMRHLDRLYGAALTASVGKRGERHLIILGMEVANAKYLPDEDDLVEVGLRSLWELAFDPATVDGAFRRDYVDQEKVNLERRIRSIIDDKHAYAFKRCTEEMFSEEPMRVHKLGRVEDVHPVTPGTLADWY
ncbi:MAG: insulinase family protein, partial [Firmicutes bacterium]|nr:insulinase family protein [Bacillota bacterium]